MRKHGIDPFRSIAESIRDITIRRATKLDRPRIRQLNNFSRNVRLEIDL